jgi:uncharacterized repeat protein (TIGR01451 family)
MVQTLGRFGTALACALVMAVLAVTVGAGCFGVSQNPNYFPHLLPDGDIIRTHAKPPGPSYFADFDPHACRLAVKPLEATNPVRTQHVFIATVLDDTGQARRDRRVEWMLEGVGNIIEVDESGLMPGRGYKVNNQYAVSYTACKEHTISRGNGNPADDFVVHPGQTWCVISSAVEGDSHVTVYAPEIHNWDNHKVFVTKHWVDADWIFPKPAINRAGTTHIFTTTICRHTDHQPLANYRVRYRILDGPPGFFLPDRTQETVAISDLSGHASVTLAQVAPAMGINRIGIEIIRPPDPSLPSGAGIVIGRGETTKEWQAPQVALNKAGPPTAVVGQEVPYTITVTNTGQVETRALTVQDIIPESLQFVRAQPTPMIEGTQLLWTLGELPGGQSRTIQVVFRSTAPGRIMNTATVVTDEGLKDQKTVATEIVAPLLKVTMTGPPGGAVGAPVNYDITVSNAGSGSATNVLLTDEFDRGLEHESKANPVELPVGTLPAGQSKVVKLSLTPRTVGTLVNRVVATADGGLTDRAEHPVLVQQPKLTLKMQGPAARYVGRPAVWNIQVTNPGDVPLNNVTVSDALPPELSFDSASEGGKVNNGQVVWTLGTLGPHDQKVVQVSTKCVKMTPQALNVATGTADPGMQAQDKAPIEIRGLPAFRLEVYDLDDPVEVGANTTYKIEVTNQGSLPGNKVQMSCTVPPQMKVVKVDGPTKATTVGQKVLFPPVESLGPKETVTYSIEVQALKAGDVRFVAELRSETLSAPVIEEESTNIYEAPAGSGPPAATPAPARSEAPGEPRPMPATPAPPVVVVPAAPAPAAGPPDVPPPTPAPVPPAPVPPPPGPPGGP